LISNSNFKIQFEFEKVFNMKLVELEILKISYLGNFSSHYMILGVIWQKQFEIRNLGGATVHRRILAGHRATWAPASRRGLRSDSRRAYDRNLVCGRLLAPLETSLKG
jgi:hypothetical protein